jgi:hypothetical protein
MHLVGHSGSVLLERWVVSGEDDRPAAQLMQLHRRCTSGDHGRLAQQWHLAWGTNNEGLLSHGWGGSCSLGVGEIWKSEATMDGSWWEGEA